RCPAQPGACKGTVTLRTRGLVRVNPKERKASILTLATGSFKIAGGQTATVKLRLNARGRTLLVRNRTVRASVLVVSRDGSGVRHVLHALATLLAPLAARR